MDNLIEALTILRKYGNPAYPTNCSHELLWIDINPELVSDEDISRLKELDIFSDADSVGFLSSFFGSC